MDGKNSAGAQAVFVIFVMTIRSDFARLRMEIVQFTSVRSHPQPAIGFFKDGGNRAVDDVAGNVGTMPVGGECSVVLVVEIDATGVGADPEIALAVLKYGADDVTTEAVDVTVPVTSNRECH